RAGRRVAGEEVPGLRRESQPDEVLRALHRAADRSDGRRGESLYADLLGQTAGSPEVSVAFRPRLYPGISHRRHDALEYAPGRRAQDPRRHGEGDAGVRL